MVNVGFAIIMTFLYLQDIVKALDKDKDGEMSLQEFLDAASKCQ